MRYINNLKNVQYKETFVYTHASVVVCNQIRTVEICL